jgi:hypothetical protein
MVVNDDAYKLNEHGALESIASKPAPTGFQGFSNRRRSFVGAGWEAMVVNDDAYKLNERGALESFASKPAPTVLGNG